MCCVWGLLFIVACVGKEGPTGPAGPQGKQGAVGSQGEQGPAGGPGEMLRLYSGVGPDIASLTRAQLNDGAIIVQHSTEGTSNAALTYALLANTPNPFNPTTQIRFDLPVAGQVELVVYDMLGQEVRTLVSSMQTMGQHQVE
jgi:hypothetical protein